MIETKVFFLFVFLRNLVPNAFEGIDSLAIKLYNFQINLMSIFFLFYHK